MTLTQGLAYTTNGDKVQTVFSIQKNYNQSRVRSTLSVISHPFFAEVLVRYPVRNYNLQQEVCLRQLTSVALRIGVGGTQSHLPSILIYLTLIRNS